MLRCGFNHLFMTNSYSNFLFEKHDLLHPSPAAIWLIFILAEALIRPSNVRLISEH